MSRFLTEIVITTARYWQCPVTPELWMACEYELERCDPTDNMEVVDALCRAFDQLGARK